MADFQDAYTDVLDYVNRPSSELLTQAKREVNNALRWLQRKRAWKMTERLVQFTYPAAERFLNLTNACEGTVRNLLNAQLLSNSSATTGRVLRITSYDDVLRKRQDFQGKHESYFSEEEFVETTTDDFHGTHIADSHRYVLFLVGENNVGLYPTPASAVEILLNLNIWLPELVADNDTNFFFTYAYDLLLMIAVNRMNYYMKEDRRQQFSQEQIAAEYQALVEWDAGIREPAK